MDRFEKELRMSDTQKEYMDKVVAEKFNFDKPYKYIAPLYSVFAPNKRTVLIEVEGQSIPYNSGVTIEELMTK